MDCHDSTKNIKKFKCTLVYACNISEEKSGQIIIKMEGPNIKVKDKIEQKFDTGSKLTIDI